MKKLFTLLMRKSGFQVWVAILVGMFSGFGSSAIIAVISRWLIGSQDFSAITLISFAGLLVGVLALDFMAKRIFFRLVAWVWFEMRFSFTRQMLSFPLRRLEEIGIPRLQAVLTEDTLTSISALYSIPPMATGIAILIGCFAYMLWLSPLAFVMVFGFPLPMILIYRLIRDRARSASRKSLAQRNVVFSHNRALTEGMKEMKVHDRRRMDFMENSLKPSLVSHTRQLILAETYFALSNSSSQLVYFFLILVLFIFASFITTTSNILISYTLVAMFLRTSVNSILNAIPLWNKAQVTVAELNKLGFDLDEAARQGEQPAIQPLTSFSEIRLKGVTHTYHMEDREGEFNLGPLDIEFKPGELVFITGSNGSGKTTLVKLLTGLYQPEAGQIILDGSPVLEADREKYTSLFSVVFSDFYVFEQLFGLENPGMDDRTQYYLEQLQLVSKVNIREGRLSTTQLSQGQRQRLALLTAFVEDRPVFIFDEWAAGQDPLFKKVYYDQLLPELRDRGKLVIVISHDDAYFSAADRLVNLDYGQITSDRVIKT